jgi:hypothetical protein
VLTTEKFLMYIPKKTACVLLFVSKTRAFTKRPVREQAGTCQAPRQAPTHSQYQPEYLCAEVAVTPV